MWPKFKPWVLYGGLFLLTFASTSAAHGPWYAVFIMTILLGHELGHYCACLKNGVRATFPIFIPMLNVLGTMGAVISMKSPVPSRKSLFDIGVSGPLAGLLLAVPALIIGIHLSDVGPRPADGAYMTLGEPMLFIWITHWLKGPIPEGSELLLHPIAFAAWAALFVTSINLLPAGQLDGGHMIHALLGRKNGRRVSYLTIAILACLGVRYHPMWYFFAALIVLFAFRSPELVLEEPTLSKNRWIVGGFTYFMMILCFTPVPFEYGLL